MRPSQQEIRSSQQEVRSSQQSITEYRTNAFRSPGSNQYIEMQNIRQEYQQPGNTNVVKTYTQTIEQKQPEVKKEEVKIVEEELDPDTI